MSVQSKLPDVGTTIFTVMSRRARETGALNLGQGFPDYPIDPKISELVAVAMAEGRNQYAPMEGVGELREQIARKLELTYGVKPNPEAEVTITLGATEAIYCAVQALVGPGEEAIVFDPSYDSYDPSVRLAGARCVHIPLLPPSFRYDWERIAATVTDRTRLIIINTPLNPACTIATRQDLDALAEIIRNRNIYVISDEVYEHVVYDDRKHVSVLSHPELRERSVAVYSFGKTLHATGIRVGYAVAPPKLTGELRKVHQFNTFSIATPFQHAIARYLAETPDCWRGLSDFFQAKRDRLRAGLEGTPIRVPPAEGTYFQLIDYSVISQADDVTFAERLLTEAGVATIPLSPFYKEPPRLNVLRLCIAKKDQTLDDAVARLHAFVKGLETVE